MDEEFWTPGEIVAAIVFIGLIFYAISWIVRYLLWRYSAPKFDADNDDEQSQIN